MGEKKNTFPCEFVFRFWWEKRFIKIHWKTFVSRLCHNPEQRLSLRSLSFLSHSLFFFHHLWHSKKLNLRALSESAASKARKSSSSYPQSSLSNHTLFCTVTFDCFRKNFFLPHKQNLLFRLWQCRHVTHFNEKKFGE